MSDSIDSQGLAAERELFRAMGRYARALDGRDWTLLETVFSPDAVAVYGGQEMLAGRDAIVRSIRGYLDGCGPSQHFMGNFAADVDGDRATTRTYARVYHQGRGERAHLSLETIGEYVADWRRGTAGWRAVRWELKVFVNVGDLSVLGP